MHHVCNSVITLLGEMEYLLMTYIIKHYKNVWGRITTRVTFKVNPDNHRCLSLCQSLTVLWSLFHQQNLQETLSSFLNICGFKQRCQKLNYWRDEGEQQWGLKTGTLWAIEDFVWRTCWPLGSSEPTLGVGLGLWALTFRKILAVLHWRQT